MGFRITRYFFDDVPENSVCELGNLTLCEDSRSVIQGRVVDCNAQPVAGAVVQVLSAPAGTPVCACPEPANLTNLGTVFTDQCGRFIFPVTPVAGLVFLLRIFAVEPPVPCPAVPAPCPDSIDCCDVD